MIIPPEKYDAMMERINNPPPADEVTKKALRLARKLDIRKPMKDDTHTAQTRYYEHLAERAHEANRILCLLNGEAVQPPWMEAPQWQKDSAVDGVRHLYDNPDATPRDSHDNWMRHKENDGWVYGPVKDPAKKEHPCMVPYDELPLAQRVKDYMFRLCVLGNIPELPPRDPRGARYVCGPQLVNAVEALVRNVSNAVPHETTLAEWDRTRKHDWFERL